MDNKKFFVIILVAALLLGVTMGCVGQQQQNYQDVKPVENLTIDDGLDTALDELTQIEGLDGP